MDLAKFKTRLEHWLGALAKAVIQGTALSLKAFVASATGSAVTGGLVPSLDLKQAAAVAGTAAVINLIDFLAKNPVPDADDEPPPTNAHPHRHQPIMKKTFTLLAVLFTVTLLSLTPGCAKKLQPGGAYAPALVNPDGSVTPTAAPDMALFVLDASYDLAYQTVLTACRLEKQNRPLLGRVFPELKREMDKVRIATWQIDQDWAAARAAYLDHPVAANLPAIQRALAEMQRWNAVATALLPKTTAPPLPP